MPAQYIIAIAKARYRLSDILCIPVQQNRQIELLQKQLEQFEQREQRYLALLERSVHTTAGEHVGARLPTMGMATATKLQACVSQTVCTTPVFIKQHVRMARVRLALIAAHQRL
jgi:hypothetical protein